ncbi:MAG: hypothetical protein AAGI01_08010 [Myxococcota bacterium]
MTSDPTRPPAPGSSDEDLRIRPTEVVLFLVFGLIPITLIYVFATSGLEDTAGKHFQEARRVMLTECMDDIAAREGCREIVDARYPVCHAELADDDGTIPDMSALRACIKEDTGGVFVAPPAKTNIERRHERIEGLNAPK